MKLHCLSIALLAACSASAPKVRAPPAPSPVEKSAPEAAATSSARDDLSHRRSTLEARLAAARDAVAKQVQLVAELQEQFREDDVRLKAVETAQGRLAASLAEARVAADTHDLPRFLVMGTVVAVEPDGRYYVHGRQIRTSGRAFTQPLFDTAILLDPRKDDLFLASGVQARDLYFRGYVRGVNGFGGPAMAAAFSHAAPPLTKAQQVAKREVDKLEAQDNRIRALIAKLSERLLPLIKARNTLTQYQERVAKLEYQLEVVCQEIGELGEDCRSSGR